MLRANHYMYDAEVKPLRCVDHRVDVEVATRDVWTLQGGFTFHRDGGTIPYSTSWYVRPDGQLDMDGLLADVEARGRRVAVLRL